MRKKILVSDTVYVLLQPCLVYFAFGDGMGRIPPQARFVLMVLVGMMMIVNLYFCEENCFQKMQKEEEKENGNACTKPVRADKRRRSRGITKDRLFSC